MTSFAERVALGEKVDRTAKTAATYLRKATDALYWHKARPLPVSYWTLLDQALTTAADIVDELPEDFFEATDSPDLFGLGVTRHDMSDEPLELARKVVAAIEARRERQGIVRRIAALENTNGRTDAEAESYRAKALELRREHGVE